MTGTGGDWKPGQDDCTRDISKGLGVTERRSAFTVSIPYVLCHGLAARTHLFSSASTLVFFFSFLMKYLSSKKLDSDIMIALASYSPSAHT